MEIEWQFHTPHMMKIELQTWFGSLKGEDDTILAQIVILLIVSMVIFSLKHAVDGALKRFKKGEK